LTDLACSYVSSSSVSLSINGVEMRTFTHGGSRFLLGQSEYGYGIWAIGRELAEPVMGFPGTAEGWADAVREFQRVEPQGAPLGSSFPQQALALPAPGYPVVPAYGPAGLQVAPQSNGMATAGGTVGIVGAVLSLIPFAGIVIGLIMGALAIIFSSMGIGRAGPLGQGRGFAITGLVLGILTVVFKLIPGGNLL
jgi:hypothetical protein